MYNDVKTLNIKADKLVNAYSIFLKRKNIKILDSKQKQELKENLFQSLKQASC